MTVRFALLIAFTLFAPQALAAFSDDDFCREMQEHARTEAEREYIDGSRNLVRRHSMS
ncbi:MAG: hypothetical protein AAB223_07070 [Pseudomonadota bacterium]